MILTVQKEIGHRPRKGKRIWSLQTQAAGRENCIVEDLPSRRELPLVGHQPWAVGALNRKSWEACALVPWRRWRGDDSIR